MYIYKTTKNNKKFSGAMFIVFVGTKMFIYEVYVGLCTKNTIN